RKFVEQPVFVNPRLDKQTALRLSDIEPLLCKHEALMVFAGRPAIPGGAVQSLGPVRTGLVGAQEHAYHLVVGMTESFLQLRRPIKADEHLLVPEAETGAIEIRGESLFGVPVVLPALRQVKGVARAQERIFLGL